MIQSSSRWKKAGFGMPVKALGRFLILVLVAILLFNTVGQAVGQSTNNVIKGIFSIVNGDPAPNSGKKHVTLYNVTDQKGVTYEVDFGAAVLPVGGVLQLNGQAVEIVGSVQPARNSANDRVVVQSIKVDKSAPQPSRNIVGTQKFISIACKFGDVAVEPRDQNFFINQLGGTRPGFNHYFREMSFNRLNLDGSTAFAWFTLPGTRLSYFTNNGANADLDKLALDCTNVAKANNVSFVGAYGINLMFNALLDGAAWGGRSVLDLDGSQKSWPTTWMPYNPNSNFGWLEHGILAHEMGHAFGAPHTGDSNGYQYGNSWDVVSNPQAGCYESTAYPTPIPGSLDGTYGCIGQHVAGVLKLGMGFYDSSKVFTYTNGSGPQTLQIERQGLPPNVAGTYLLAIIPSPTNANISYSVEAHFRAANSYDLKTRGDGVIIYRTDDSRNGNNVEKTWLLPPPGATADSERCNDNPPVCGVGAAQAIWAVGSTMTNATDGVTIRIDAFSNNGTATVTINPGQVPPPPTINTQPQSQTISSGQTANLSVAATGDNLTYQWYQGQKGDTTTPVGTNSANFTTPALVATTSYWVRVSNAGGNADSETATITVNQVAPIVVTKAQDAGSPTDDNNQGTLTYALKNAAVGQAITFNLNVQGPNRTGAVGNNVINVTGPLPTPTNAPIIIDGGNCTSGPAITINGAGVPDGVDGFTVTKSMVMKNLKIVGFKGVQLRIFSGGIESGGCLVISKE